MGQNSVPSLGIWRAGACSSLIRLASALQILICTASVEQNEEPWKNWVQIRFSYLQLVSEIIWRGVVGSFGRKLNPTAKPMRHNSLADSLILDCAFFNPNAS
jgi:hypothetical protein